MERERESDGRGEMDGERERVMDGRGEMDGERESDDGRWELEEGESDGVSISHNEVATKKKQQETKEQKLERRGRLKTRAPPRC